MPSSSSTPPLRRDSRLAARAVLPAVIAAVCLIGGCGTTRWSDSKRTATEQLLVSDAIERAVMRIDMQPLAGRSTFLDTASLDDVSDGKYLASALRHKLLASGCALASEREKADLVVEARAGAVGTDRNELLLGIPATSVSVGGNGTSLPEMALAKRTDQRAVAKVNICAYERASGVAVWQSGVENVASHTRDRWLFGTGPFQDGDINDGTEFAGEKIHKPKSGAADETAVAIDLRQPKVYAAPAAADPVGATATADARPVHLPSLR
ncbi:MAG: hypothetical protein K8S94_07145 [Planctomycetia bacterium]|nr:hypothetical protein [Planctomycetia bacterium]